MATLYENYITGDDGNRAFYQTVSWQAQTFTPSTSHTITIVKLKLLRYAGASPGTVTISIQGTDGEGKPDNTDLVSGTTDGDDITTTSPGEWIEIELGAGTALTASTKYAIVAKCSSDNLSLPLYWRMDTSSPSYAGGSRADSGDEGVSWTLDTDDDLMFEEWGEAGGSGSALPVVYTQACTNTIAEVSKGWGILNSIGDAAVTQHGHCWATTTNPTTSDSKTSLGAKPNLGQFQSNITDLTPGATYYVRAYATNSYGTAYGQNVTIATSSSIGRRYWWTEFEDFHYFGESGTEYIVSGSPTTSDHGGIMDWM